MINEINNLLFSNHPYPMWIYDLETLQFLAVNHAAILQYGYTEAEFLQMQITEIRPEEEVSALLADVQRERPDRQISEGWRHRAKDGTLFDVRIVSHTIPYNGRRAALVVVEDISERSQITESLKQSQQQYQQIVETTQEGIWKIDAESKTSYVNARMAEMLGYTREEMLGRDLFDFMDEQGAAEATQNLQRRQEGVREEHEFRFKHKDGSDVWTLLSTNPLLDENGRYEGALAMLVDITQRKKMQIALRQSEARFRTLVQKSSDVMTIVDGSGTITYQSPAARHVFGYEPEEMEGQSAFAFLHPDEIPRLQASFEKILTNPDLHITETMRFRHKDGSWRVIESTGQNLLDDPNVCGIVTNARDITEQAAAEAALAESEALYRSLVETSPDAITLTDLHGNIIITNQQAASLHGFITVEELLGESAFNFIAPEDLERAAANAQKTLTEGSVQNVEYSLLTKDGRRIPVELSASLVRDAAGQPKAFIGVTRDISQRKAAEEALKASEEKYQQLYDSAPDLFVSVDPKTAEVLHCNQTVFKKLGYTKEEIIGSAVFDLYHPDCLDDVRKVFDTFVKTGEVHNAELQLKHKDGTRINVILNVSAVRDEEGNVLYSSSIWRDITDLKQVQEALATSERLHRTLTETLPHIIWLADDDGQVTFLNRAWYKLTGLTAEESMGTGWVKAVHPDDVAPLLARWEKAYTYGQDYQGECRFLTADGSERTFSFIGTPVRDEMGKVVNWVGINIDITEEREARKALHESKRQLNTRAQQQAAVARIGHIALGEVNQRQLFEKVVEVVADTLQSPFCKVLELLPSGEEMVLQAGVGWQAGVEPGITTLKADLSTLAGYTLAANEAVIVDQLDQETRFASPPLLLAHGIVSGMSVVIRGGQMPFGVLGVYSDSRRKFTRDDVNFLVSVANILSTVMERQAFQAQANYLATIVQSTQDAIIGKTLEGIIKSWNAGAEKMYGYTAVEAIGHHISLIAPPDKVNEIDEFLVLLSRGERIYHFETRRRRKDGQILDVSLSISPIFEADGTIAGAAAIGRDISDLKRAQRIQERLLESERFAHEAAVQARQRLAFLVEAGKILGSSLDYEQTLRTVTQLATPHIADWCVANLVDQNQQLRQVSVAHVDPAKVSWAQQLYEIYYPDPDSDTGSLRVLRTGEAELYEEITDEMLVQGAKNEEHLALLRQLNLCSSIIVPMVIHGKPIGTITFASSQKDRLFGEADLVMAKELAARAATAVENARLYQETKQFARTLEERVRQRTAQLEMANKELEAFAYSVSHDLRAPLRAMDGFSRILLEESADDPDDKSTFYLKRIRHNAQQMGDLIDDLLTFSRLSRKPLKTEQLELTPLVENIVQQLLEEHSQREIQITINPLPPCQADFSLLTQVYSNLLTNAIKYSQSRAKTKIIVGSKEESGNTVYFVQDNGVGFNNEYAEKVFGAFQRLHRAEEYEGTGVGLAIVQRIIHRHGGRVWAEAEVDKGATFYFTLNPEESP